MYPVSKQVKRNLAEHKLLQLAVKTYKKDGFLEISNHACEKWNYPVFLSDCTDIEKPKADGSYDVEGQSSCDITVRLRRNFLTLSFVGEILKYFNHLIKAIDFNDFKFLVKAHPFKRYFTAWLWVVDSFKVSRIDYAEKILQITKPGLLLSKSYEAWSEELEVIKSKISDVDLALWLSSEGHKISASIYLNGNDPTVFSVNERYMPFSLKDGWSNEDMKIIISLWFRKLNYDFRNIRLERQK